MRNVSRSLFGQDSSMSPKRQRSVSNLNVGVREYLSALMSWRSQHSGQSYQQLLGPTWCREIRQVTPHSLSRCYGLLNALVEIGVHNGVLFPSKFEIALKESIVRDPSALSASSNHATIITDITDHIRVNFSMVRQLVFEDEEMPCRRRYCKTGVLRRMATASQLVLINNLIRKMNFDKNATVSDGGEVRESPRHMSSSEELLVTERIFPVAGRVSVDDEGFPLVFPNFTAFVWPQLALRPRLRPPPCWPWLTFRPRFRPSQMLPLLRLPPGFRSRLMSIHQFARTPVSGSSSLCQIEARGPVDKRPTSHPRKIIPGTPTAVPCRTDAHQRKTTNRRRL